MNQKKTPQLTERQTKARFHKYSIFLIGTTLLIGLYFPMTILGQSKTSIEETPTALLEALQQRNREIDEREKKVIEEEGRLDVIKKEVKGMLNEYIKLKEIVDLREAEHTITLKKQEEERINRLAKIYQIMEAEEAASRIKRMKKSTALDLLRKIKEKQTAKILSKMDPETATHFSEAFIKSDK